MTAIALREDNIDRYIREVSKHPLLSHDEELSLARRLRDEGDVGAAHSLVVSNLRFVVKIAHQYRGYGLNLVDLIQEGNLGLMLAVKKFDPDRGYRLITYAVWWIRAQIRSFIVRSFSLVKIGTTYAQRKLFFSLRGARAKAEQKTQGAPADAAALATELGVSENDINDMQMRLAAHDFSLDARFGDEVGAPTHLEVLPDAEPLQEERLAKEEDRQRLRNKVEGLMKHLNEKERYIVEQRLLNDEPKTLAEIGDTFHVSRERVRQLETRILKKLREAFVADQEAA